MAQRHGRRGHVAQHQAAGDGSLAALGGREGPGHPAAGLGWWVQDVGGMQGAGGVGSVAVLLEGMLSPGWGCSVPGGMLGPGWDARSVVGCSARVCLARGHSSTH